MQLKTISSILLISSTAVGGGILALPCATVHNGYMLSNIIFVICWFFMTISSLYMLEVTLWFKNNINVSTMISQTLGFKWKVFLSIIYILLLYSLINAYILAYDKWLKKILIDSFKKEIIQTIYIFFFTILTIIITIYKESSIEKLSYYLSVMLFIIYITLILTCITKINITSLKTLNIENLNKNISLIITSFGFCIVIPTIATYLKKQTNKIYFSIIAGSIIPLTVYIIWQTTILGIFPINSDYSLYKLSQKETDLDIMFIYFVEKITNSETIPIITLLFAMLSILTSAIGVMLSLIDFLSDQLEIKKNKNINKIILIILIITPPIMSTLFLTNNFTLILKFSGILVSILLGITPSLMVWQGRYKLKIQSSFTIKGGKFLIVIVILFFIYIITNEIYLLK